MNSNRRQFLRKSLLGISGAAMLPEALGNPPSSSCNRDMAIDLPARQIGKTGIMAPVISLGTSGTTNPDFIRAAWNAGIKLFFSATYYGEGNNEIIVGNALKDLPRESYIVATAAPCNEVDNRTGLLRNDFNARAYIEKAEGSLKRFGLEHIDILLFPYAARKETLTHEGIIRTMEQLKQQGKVRFTGIASHNGTEEALYAAAGAGVYDLAMISYNFKIQNKKSIDEAISKAAAAGMGIVAMKTTAGVFRDKNGPGINTEAAMKWVLQNENISSVVSGMSTIEQLRKNLNMTRNLRMSDQERNDLIEAMALSETGLYCQQCGQCIPGCPGKLDIPSIMRSYMYAYGYHNTSQAWNNLARTGISDHPCKACTECNVNCASGFDVRAKIEDISRLIKVPKEFLMT